jgi:hypothetical protein
MAQILKELADTEHDRRESDAHRERRMRGAGRQQPWTKIKERRRESRQGSPLHDGGLDQSTF